MINQSARRRASDGQADVVSAERFGWQWWYEYLWEVRSLCYLQNKGEGATMPCASNSYEWQAAMKESPVLPDESYYRLVLSMKRKCRNRGRVLLEKFPFLPGYCALHGQGKL